MIVWRKRSRQVEELGKVDFKGERIIIFIDHANIFHPCQELGVRIDYRKFKELMTQKSYLVGAFMYLGMPDKISAKKEKFLKYLTEMAGYTIQTRPLKVLPPGTTKQRGIDIFIYKDIVELAEEDAYDKAVLVSGDADFVDAVRKLKALKKRFVIWSFRKSLSKLLRKEAGEENIRYIDNILKDISRQE